MKKKYVHYFSIKRNDIFKISNSDNLSLYLLNSKTFWLFFKNEQIITDIVYCIFSVILKMICIQHNRNDMMKILKKNDIFKIIQISDVISHYLIVIMKLWMIMKKQIAHDQYYFSLVCRLCKSKRSIKKVNLSDELFSVENKTSWMNMWAFCCLMHLVFLSKLKCFVTYTDISNLSNDISKWIMKYNKKVFFLIAWIKQDDELLMSQDYFDIIYYTAHENFKLRYLTKILYDIMIRKK